MPEPKSGCLPPDDIPTSWYFFEVIALKKEKISDALFLFRYFFHISWFTFGGGWSIVAQMEKEFVDKRKEISSQELLDIISVGRSLPGTMISNIAYLFGYSRCGFLGGILSVLGIVIPPMLILSLVTMGYTAFRNNLYVAKMLTGVRAAVVPIIFVAALKLRKGAFSYGVCRWVTVIGCILSLLLNVNCVWIIVFGMMCGFLISWWKGESL